MPITITLNPEQERLVAQAMERAGYRDVDDVIVHALEALRAEDGILHETKDAISTKVDRAFAQFERGEFMSAEQSRLDMEQRKSAWLRDQQR